MICDYCRNEVKILSPKKTTFKGFTIKVCPDCYTNIISMKTCQNCKRIFENGLAINAMFNKRICDNCTDKVCRECGESPGTPLVTAVGSQGEQKRICIDCYNRKIKPKVINQLRQDLPEKYGSRNYQYFLSKKFKKYLLNDIGNSNLYDDEDIETLLETLKKECPKCNEIYLTWHNFCKRCGASLKEFQFCLSCKRHIPVNANFCSYCGTAKEK